MKILIVDDNVAIQEIVRDILSDEGYLIRTAGTIEEAITKTADFLPDVVVLDSRVGDEEGLHYLTRLKEEVPEAEPKVVLLKNATELVPKDSPYIKASVDKPFRSSDIVSAIRGLHDEEPREEPKVEKRHLFGFLRRRKKTDEEPPEMLDVSFGTSYVMFEQGSELAYRFVNHFDPEANDVMIVTTDRSKAVKERFSYGTMEVLTLSSNGKAGSESIRDIGTITSLVRAFMDQKDRPVVVFDKFGEVISADGINQSLLMLQQLMSGKTRMCTLAVSVDPSVLTDKDRDIILHNMVEYSEKE